MLCFDRMFKIYHLLQNIRIPVQEADFSELNDEPRRGESG